MSRRLRYGVLVGLLASIPFSPSLATPANPRSQIRTQPDGSSVTVMQRGDEGFHYLLGVDGYPLGADSSGVLRYVEVGGGISAQQAHDPAARTAEESAFLAGVDTARIFQQFRSSAPRKPAGGVAAKGARKLASEKALERINRPVVWKGSAPNTGVVKGLVLLVQFSDSTFKLPDPKAEYAKFMNEAGYSGYGMSGSVRDYFIATSDSQFMPSFDVYGPVTLSKPATYYGGNYNGLAAYDTAVGAMVAQACLKLKDGINWADYDYDGDDTVDFVYVFYAGKGESDGGAAASIWPQAGNLATPLSLGGKYVRHYAVSNERSGSASSYALDGIGTFCHEFCHVLGLPDIYQTVQGTTLSTPSYWDLMDIGVYDCADATYGNSSCTPPYLNALERYTLGWLTPTTLDSGRSPISLANIGKNTALILPSSHDSEFFLLENRQLTTWDAGLPGHGMLIWHVNYDSTTWNANDVNNTSLRVDVVEADGVASYGDAGDPFPGTSKVKSFSKFTTWAKATLVPSLHNITESDGMVCFTTTSAAQTLNCTAGPTATIAQEIRSGLSLNGTDLVVGASASGWGVRRLDLYAMDGHLVRTSPISSARATVSMSELRGDGMLVARLVQGGALVDQKRIVLP